MDFNKFFNAINAELNEDKDNMNLNFNNPLYQMPNEITFNEDGWSNVIIFNSERPDWVHDFDIVSFDVHHKTADYAINHTKMSCFWEDELAFCIFDRNKNNEYINTVKSKIEPEQERYMFYAIDESRIHVHSASSKESAENYFKENKIPYNLLLSENDARAFYLMFQFLFAVDED